VAGPPRQKLESTLVSRPPPRHRPDDHRRPTSVTQLTHLAAASTPAPPSARRPSPPPPAGAGQPRGGGREAQRPRGPRVYHELERGRLRDGQVRARPSPHRSPRARRSIWRRIGSG